MAVAFVRARPGKDLEKPRVGTFETLRSYRRAAKSWVLAELALRPMALRVTAL
jgi:hypothetical protein